MAKVLVTVNLEQGMPTAEQAQKRLIGELAGARAAGAKAVKLIHGYGSSGVGGKLRIGVRQWLQNKRRQGGVRVFVAGEDWDIFDDTSRSILEACPDLSKDSDLGKGNAGITIVLL